MKNRYISYAIALGYRGLGSTKDNPSVGAIIVKNGKIIGKGHTQPPPGKHAEIVALEMAGKEAKGADMYVTLEPCSFYGRTPACSLEIVKSGIKRVFIGSIDPNPKVAGKGIEILKSNGIEVEFGILNKQCDYLHRFFYHNIKNRTPYITIKYAQTLDGYIAREDGNSKWISNNFSRRYAHKLRVWHDAILVGYNTFINDNPSLNIRYNLKNNDITKIVMLNSIKEFKNSIELYKDRNLFNDGKNIIIVSENKSEDSIVFEKLFFNNNKNIYLIQYNNLEQFLIYLKDNFGIYSLLVEGGAKTVSKFVNNNFFNELNIFIAPKIFKKGRSPYFSINDLNLNLEFIKKFQNDLLLIYRNNRVI